jgi:hypothetical protein
VSELLSLQDYLPTLYFNRDHQEINAINFDLHEMGIDIPGDDFSNGTV